MSEGLPFDTRWTSEGEVVLVFRTPLTYDQVEKIWKDLSALFRNRSFSSLVLDLEAATKIDSAGVALLRAVQRNCNQRDIGLEFVSVPASTQHFLDLIQQHPPKEKTKPSLSPRILINRIGFFVLRIKDELAGFARFTSEVVATAARSLFHIRGFRWGEMLYYLQLSGANAMTIIFLVGFLLGLVLAFQAAIQLRQFGANIYVADLVSLALTRELAPVFAAMTMAGRSGSAYAAEIGTMKVGEELDALTVMGFNLNEYIVLPKVVALMISAPLLTMWCNLAGVLGGITVGILSLDLTAYGFMAEIYTVLTVRDIATGLIKAEFFAILIALIGCYRGFQTGKGADSVGRQTTSAVVSGLFLIIFTDAVFTVFFNAIGW